MLHKGSHLKPSCMESSDTDILTIGRAAVVPSGTSKGQDLHRRRTHIEVHLMELFASSAFGRSIDSGSSSCDASPSGNRAIGGLSRPKPATACGLAAHSGRAAWGFSTCSRNRRCSCGRGEIPNPNRPTNIRS